MIRKKTTMNRQLKTTGIRKRKHEGKKTTAARKQNHGSGNKPKPQQWPKAKRGNGQKEKKREYGQKEKTQQWPENQIKTVTRSNKTRVTRQQTYLTGHQVFFGDRSTIGRTHFLTGICSLFVSLLARWRKKTEDDFLLKKRRQFGIMSFSKTTFDAP